MNANTTGIGSLPHHNIDSALAFSMRHGVPFLPQIPIRNPWEFMIAQALEGLPGLRVERDGEVSLNPALWASRAAQFDARLERAFREGTDATEAFSEFEPSAAASSSWQPFLWELSEAGKKIAKIQIAGPITCQWAVRLSDGSSLEKQPDIASQIFRLVLARSLAMTRRLRASGISPILFLDEPGLYAYSPSNPRHVLAIQELKLLVQTLRKEGVAVGIHCCSNMDWKAVLAMELSYLSLDTALSLEGLLQGPKEDLRSFLERGGRFSFGVIPTGRSSAIHAAVSQNSSNSAAPSARLFSDLKTKLLSAFAGSKDDPSGEKLTRKVLTEALYTPACGLALQSIPDAELIAETLFEISREVQSA